uniref:Uncharacterized protein n=1 Tax=Anopheles albimanus TaxID=7167 RepID=A0A182FZD1_ANOAL
RDDGVCTIAVRIANACYGWQQIEAIMLMIIAKATTDDEAPSLFDEDVASRAEGGALHTLLWVTYFGGFIGACVDR